MLQTKLLNMRFIDTKTHGFIDYIMSLFIALSPWIFNYNNGGAETWVPLVVGITGVLYSLITNYELGISRILSMRTHLSIDVAAGIFLAVSPWVLAFNDEIWQPHLVLGILVICVSLFTKTDTRSARPGKNPLINI